MWELLLPRWVRSNGFFRVPGNRRLLPQALGHRGCRHSGSEERSWPRSYRGVASPEGFSPRGDACRRRASAWPGLTHGSVEPRSRRPWSEDSSECRLGGVLAPCPPLPYDVGIGGGLTVGRVRPVSPLRRATSRDVVPVRGQIGEADHARPSGAREGDRCCRAEARNRSCPSGEGQGRGMAGPVPGRTSSLRAYETDGGLRGTGPVKRTRRVLVRGLPRRQPVE